MLLAHLALLGTTINTPGRYEQHLNGAIPTRMTSYIKHAALPWNNWLALQDYTCNAGTAVFVPGSIPSGNAPDMLLGIVTNPASSTTPNGTLLNFTAKYACTSPSGACDAFPSATVDVIMYATANSSGTGVQEFGFRHQFSPQNLTASGATMAVDTSGSIEPFPNEYSGFLELS